MVTRLTPHHLTGSDYASAAWAAPLRHLDLGVTHLYNEVGKNIRGSVSCFSVI